MLSGKRKVTEPGQNITMGITGNFYDTIQTGKRDSSKTNACAITQAQDTQTKVSSSPMRWAFGRLFTGLAILGWICFIIFTVDTLFFSNSLMIKVLAQ